ncbi:hypothetical protein, conserved [Eimeria maxima]|uniref:Uncharacterized protein n=1 Tax=Eimeria maxima TaxID=5804 RepID=U6M7E9_EIMMA|nr:hypothetical protein, conserved [Eimeria maxima]CDJ57570.1 hypothetical protein, conserved [Eimeria maxima]
MFFFLLVPLLYPLLRVYSALELSDIFWRLSILSIPLSRAAAAAAAAAAAGVHPTAAAATLAAAAAAAEVPAAAAAPGPERILAFKEELLLQLKRRHQSLQRQLGLQQQQKQHQQQQQPQEQQHQQHMPQPQQLLLVYRVLYGAAKLKMKFSEAPEIFSLVVEKACELLELSESPEGLGFRVLTPSQIVRIVWACAALQTPEATVFFKARERILGCIDSLAYEEIEVLLQVYEAVGMEDNQLTATLQQELQRIAPLARGTKISAPRRRNFKRKEKRVSMTDPIPSYSLAA